MIICAEKSKNGFNTRSENLHCRTLFCRKIGKKVYASKFVDAPPLNRKNISRLVNKFYQTGTVNNSHHHRTRIALPPETLAKVSNVISETSNKSLQRVTEVQIVSYDTAHRATCTLQLHPYHIRVTHKLSSLDSDQCLHDCNWLLTNFTPVPTQPTLLNVIFFPDDVWFSLSRYVNRRSNCYWAANNSNIHLKYRCTKVYRSPGVLIYIVNKMQPTCCFCL